MSTGLRTLITSVASSNPEANPHELAEIVAKSTDLDRVMDFYTQALVPMVRDVLGEERRGAMDGLTKPKNRSAKLEQRRSWWADLCASRVHVGDSVWKELGACTVDELQFCIDDRKAHIARVESQIGNYEHLIKLMVKHGARTVADLPAQKSWGAAA